MTAEHNAEFLRELAHELRRRTVGDRLDRVVPLGRLLRAKVRPIKDFLQTDDLRAARLGIANQAHVFFDRSGLVFLDRLRAVDVVAGLNQSDRNF
jgi:hypothetical protein